MALLISIILFQTLPLFLVTFSHICPHAVFAIMPQSVFAVMVLAKLTLVFPLFAFGTAFLFYSTNNPMSFLISEVFSRIFPISLVVIAFVLSLTFNAPITKSKYENE